MTGALAPFSYLVLEDPFKQTEVEGVGKATATSLRQVRLVRKARVVAFLATK